MNRVKPSSSDTQTKKLPTPHPPPEKKERNLKRERLPANPLRGFSKISSGSNTCSSSNGSSNVSTSGESSNGCQRFLLSHSFSSSSSTSSSMGPVRSVAKTPKSAPVLSKPLIRKKPRLTEEIKLKPTFVTEKPQRCKPNPSSRKRVIGSEKGSVFKKQSSVSTREVKLKEKQSSQIVTPVSKLGTGSNDDGCNSSYKERTPPVQASVSPEMHCGSSMNVSASSQQSQACYAAGHLLSGVSDKRKCKPKGILTVCENGFEVAKAKLLDDFDDYNDGSVMPLPSDASVHWLLSPCEEEEIEHEKEESDDGFSPLPLSDLSASSDLCNISSGKSLSPMKRRTSSSLSPHELSRFRRFMELSSSEDLKGDKLSPLSLGSENVMQTPESNSSFESYFGLQGEIQKKQEVGSVLKSVTTDLQAARLSPRSHSSSFNFDSLATSSDTVDLSQFHRGLADKSSHQVSWREEVHREDDASAGKGRELLPLSAAESISTDGGGLICSEDSNWMACYKN